MKSGYLGKTVLSLVIMVGLMTSGLSTVFAQNSETQFTADDFYVDWGTWTFEDNVITETAGTNRGTYLSNNANYFNCIVEADVTINDDDTNHGVGLIARAINRSNGYYFWYHKGELKITEYASNEFVLAKTSVSLEKGKSYHFKAVLQDEFFEFYLDDTLMLTASDTSFTKGKFGMVANWAKGATFANVSVTALDPMQKPNGYFDDFQDNNVDNWSVWTGEWKVTSDPIQENAGNLVYAQTGNSATQRTFVGDTKWKNYTLSAKVYADALNDNGFTFGLVTNAKDANHYHYFDYQVKTGKLRIMKVDGTWSGEMASSSITAGMKEKEWYLFKVSSQNGKLDFSVYDSQGNLFAQVSSARDDLFSCGQIGLFAHWTKNVYFDDVKVEMHDPTATTPVFSYADDDTAVDADALTAGKTLKASVNIVGPAGDTARVYLAIFDKETNTLKKVEIKDEWLGYGTSAVDITTDITENEAGCSAKVFVWNLGMKPFKMN